jgi:hypothetical protein
VSETKPRVGLFGHRGLVWRALGSWVMPVVMAVSYTFVVVTSDTDSSVQLATRAAWLSVGLAFVLVVWWLFKVLVGRAALARAAMVGDGDRLREMVDYELARRRGAARAPYLVYRAFAHELGGEWPAALAALDEAGRALPPRVRLLAGCVRVAALVETGDVAAARAVLDTDVAAVRPHDHAGALDVALATARVQLAENDRDGAAAALARIADDVRAAARVRAVARELLSRARLSQKLPLAAKPT